MKRKIAFFDIDGTLISEKADAIPDSAVIAIREARERGHYMFINTGRTFCNVEQRVRDIGFDGFVCGCGTNIYYHGEELFYLPQTREVTEQILAAARRLDVDIFFESREENVPDLSRPFHNPTAKKLYYMYKGRHYDMSHHPDADDFICDKFIIWYERAEQLSEFRKVSDVHFDCIDREPGFCEFVPHGYSKATGIQFLLEQFGIDNEDAYAFGDSNNDLPMLLYVPHSVAMGNSMPEELKKQVSYVTDKASEDGIAKALKALGFLD
jgi:hypothetical protein